MKHNQKGFTLLELVLVATIIAVMAMIAAPTLMQKNRSKSVNAFSEELNWTLEIIRRYFAINGVFPTAWTDLTSTGALPRIPVDPYGGTVTLITNNAVTPKTCTIRITNGVAATDYANIILRRVPFGTHYPSATPPYLDITINEFMSWIFQEVVYMGIHADGDVVAKRPCQGSGQTNYPVIAPVVSSAQGDAALQSFRVWVNDLGANYVTHCEVYDESQDTSTTNCLVQFLQICHY